MGFWEMKQFFSLLESPLGSPQLIVFMSSQRQMSWEKSFLWNVPNPAEPFRTPLAGSFPASFLSLILFSFASCSCTDDVHTSLLVAPKSRACKKPLRASWSSVAYACLRFSAISRPHHVFVYYLWIVEYFEYIIFKGFYCFLFMCICESVNVWHVPRAWESFFGITLLLLEWGGRMCVRMWLWACTYTNVSVFLYAHSCVCMYMCMCRYTCVYVHI